MRTIRTTAVLLGLLLTVPAFSLASSGQSQSKSSASKTTPAPSSAVHATKGVVKSVDDTSLVITRPSGKVKEMTFVISPATARKGALTCAGDERALVAGDAGYLKLTGRGRAPWSRNPE